MKMLCYMTFQEPGHNLDSGTLQRNAPDLERFNEGKLWAGRNWVESYQGGFKEKFGTVYIPPSQWMNH